MSYKDFNIGSAIKTFNISKISSSSKEFDSFFNEFKRDNKFACSESFTKEIEFSLEVYRNAHIHSESWLRENFISPFLREIWKNHKMLYIWQGFSLNADASQGLTGEPDYYVTKNSGIPDAPYCIVGEAKKENFENGWGQRLACMKGAEILNKKENINIPIYGIVTSGVYWQFGKLMNNQFSIYPEGYLSIFDSSIKILEILDTIFTQCERHINTSE